MELRKIRQNEKLNVTRQNDEKNDQKPIRLFGKKQSAGFFEIKKAFNKN